MKTVVELCMCEHSSLDEARIKCLNCGLPVYLPGAKPISFAVASEITKPPEPVQK